MPEGSINDVRVCSAMVHLAPLQLEELLLSSRRSLAGSRRFISALRNGVTSFAAQVINAAVAAAPAADNLMMEDGSPCRCATEHHLGPGQLAG